MSCVQDDRVGRGSGRGARGAAAVGQLEFCCSLVPNQPGRLRHRQLRRQGAVLPGVMHFGGTSLRQATHHRDDMADAYGLPSRCSCSVHIDFSRSAFSNCAHNLWAIVILLAHSGVLFARSMWTRLNKSAETIHIPKSITRARHRSADAVCSRIVAATCAAHMPQ